MSKVYTIASGKGGVGKTTIAANLGVSLSKLGKKTVVVGADLAMGGVATIFGLGETPVTLHEVLSGKGNVDKAIYLSQGVSVVPSGPTVSGFLSSDPKKLKDVIAKLTDTYDYVIVDSPPGLSRYSLEPLKVADEVLLVVTPDLPAIYATAKLQTVLRALNAKVGGVIINRFKKPSFFSRLGGGKYLKSEDIERRLKAEILGTIPEDPAVIESVNEEKSVVVRKPKSPASKAFQELAKKLTKPAPKKPAEPAPKPTEPVPKKPAEKPVEKPAKPAPKKITKPKKPAKPAHKKRRTK
jgi:septum site-determining protein MinD